MNDTPNKAGLGQIGQQLSYPLDFVTQEIIRELVERYAPAQRDTGMEVFTSSGTFTAPFAGSFRVRLVGGGAGGGSTGGSNATGTSGGGGAYVESMVELDEGEAVSVTIGAGGAGDAAGGQSGDDGGDTSFGAYCTAQGGFADGTGGVASGGDLNIDGGAAGPAITLYGAGSTTNAARKSGDAGGSRMGQGAFGALGDIGSQSGGKTAVMPGGGGSGGASGTAGSDAGGGSGADGILIVEW